jgi:hypothetical protein
LFSISILIAGFVIIPLRTDPQTLLLPSILIQGNNEMNTAVENDFVKYLPVAK